MILVIPISESNRKTNGQQTPHRKENHGDLHALRGNIIRSIERMTGVHRDTIMRLGVRVGQGCAEIMDDKMNGLDLPQIQVDEMWGFIGAKEKTAKANDMGPDFG